MTCATFDVANSTEELGLYLKTYSCFLSWKNPINVHSYSLRNMADCIAVSDIHFTLTEKKRTVVTFSCLL